MWLLLYLLNCLSQPRSLLTFTFLTLSPTPLEGVSEQLRGAELLAGVEA